MVPRNGWQVPGNGGVPGNDIVVPRNNIVPGNGSRVPRNGRRVPRNTVGRPDRGWRSQLSGADKGLIDGESSRPHIAWGQDTKTRFRT